MPKPARSPRWGWSIFINISSGRSKSHRDYHLDRQYVVKPGEQGTDEIVIVDEYTGRLAEGRKWRDGIHQAVEAKEKIEVTVPTGQAARITVQDLFLRYKYLAGMTGTASTAARELRKVYHKVVIPVPTNRPAQREAAARPGLWHRRRKMARHRSRKFAICIWKAGRCLSARDRSTSRSFCRGF